MKRAILFLVSISLIQNSFAFENSKPKHLINSHAILLNDAIAFVKKFKNLKDFYLYADTILPSSGYDKYAKWIDENGLSQVQLSQLSVQSNKVYWPGIKEPFHIMNDSKTVLYKGIGATFNPKHGPEKMHQTAKDAWGHFSEFKPTKAPHVLIRLLRPHQAQAQTTKESQELVIVGSGAALGGFVIGIMDMLIAGGFSVGVLSGALFYGGIALALYGASRWAWLNLDDKANKLSDSELICSHGQPILRSKKENFAFRSLPQLTRAESEQSEKALMEICKNPEAVIRFNDAFTLTKKKIYSGKASYFTKEDTSAPKMQNAPRVTR